MKTKTTIQDIARLAGVSKATVSHYLNEHYDKMSAKTRERIRAAIEDTGYRPSTAARSLNAKSTRLLGVIIGDLTNSFSNQLIKGLTDYVQSHDYQLILASSHQKEAYERKYLNSMADMGVDGFLVQPSPHFEEVWNELSIDRPLVYFDSPPKGSSALYVKTDSYRAVYEAMEMTVQRGYRHFLMLTADPTLIVTRQERASGFLDCITRHDLSYEVLLAGHTTTADELTALLTPYILKYEKLCIFAANNWLLKKAFQALQDFRALIPQQIGLLGMDAYEWNNLVVPPITTILQPAEQEGIEAGRLLIHAVEGKSEALHSCILPCRINEQLSTMMQ